MIRRCGNSKERWRWTIEGQRFDWCNSMTFWLDFYFLRRSEENFWYLLKQFRANSSTWHLIELHFPFLCAKEAVAMKLNDETLTLKEQQTHQKYHSMNVNMAFNVNAFLRLSTQSETKTVNVKISNRQCYFGPWLSLSDDRLLPFSLLIWISLSSRRRRVVVILRSHVKEKS